jgi:hypothetical protein
MLSEIVSGSIKFLRIGRDFSMMNQTSSQKEITAIAANGSFAR